MKTFEQRPQLIKSHPVIQTRKCRKMAENRQKSWFFGLKPGHRPQKLQKPQKTTPQRQTRGILPAFQVCFRSWVSRACPRICPFRLQKWSFWPFLGNFMILTISFGYFDAEFGNFSEFLVIVGLEFDLIWLKTSNSANLSRFRKDWPVSRPKFRNV